MITFIMLIIVLVAIMVYGYNALQQNSHKVKESASNVQVSISKKISLINQLIDAVRNYQESEQFTQLKISQDNNAANMMASYQQSGTLLSSIQGFAERFPNLKASDQYQKLMDRITECELNIQSNREKYNKSVNFYNTHRSKIPAVFVAQLMGFSEAPYLQFDTSGNSDGNILKDFKTDDGERLRQLFNKAGGNIAVAAKSISHHTGDLSKMIAEKISAKPGDLFYYLVPDGVPKGPKPLDEINRMLEEGIISPQTRIALSGTDEWIDLVTYSPGNNTI